MTLGEVPSLLFFHAQEAESSQDPEKNGAGENVYG